MGKSKAAEKPIITGARGGTTAGFVKKGTGETFYRKTLYLLEHELDALKHRAVKDRVTDNEIMRRALNRYLGLKGKP